jgi:Xaa-Pro dipeptidase
VSAPPLYDPGRLEACLARAGFDALAATTAPNVLHLTRFRKPGGALALVARSRPERPLLLVPAANVDFVVEDLGQGVDVRAYGSFFRYRAEGARLTGAEAVVDRVHAATRADADLAGLCAAAVSELGLEPARVALDASPPGLLDLGLVPIPALARELRRVKTPEELGRLRRAARVAEAALEATVAAARPGATQCELAREFRLAVVRDSAQVRLDNVSLGRSTALGNANRPDDVLAEGDVVRFDVGAIFEGYASDLSRCFACGEPEPLVLARYEALLAGQEAALALVRPGVTAGELFAVAVRTVRDAGIPHYGRTNIGHGIGLAGDGYDAPLLAPGDDTPLEQGMVLCVETPYYELGFGGLQVEDMVAVTASGYEPLTTLPRALRTIR